MKLRQNLFPNIREFSVLNRTNSSDMSEKILTKEICLQLSTTPSDQPYVDPYFDAGEFTKIELAAAEYLSKKIFDSIIQIV